MNHTLTCSLFLCVMVFQTLDAQVRVGLNGGFYFSGAEQNNFYHSQAVTGATNTFGGILDLSLTDHLSFMLNPMLIEKGTSANPIQTRELSPTFSFSTSSLEIPLLIKYSIGNQIRPYILFGPVLGMTLSSRLRADVQGSPYGQLELEADASNLVDDLEYSLEFGGGLQYQIDEFLDLFFEARYNHGLHNILKHGNVNIKFADQLFSGELLENASYKNKGFSVTLGFTFPLRFHEQ